MSPLLRFADLISPLTPAAFYTQAHGKTAAYFSGRRRRFAHLFSWAEFTRLLNMTSVWTDQTTKLVLDGRTIKSDEYCRSVRSREGTTVMQADPKRVHHFLHSGATLVLDLAERLSPGLSEICDALQFALGAPVACNIYCSWEGRKGFPPHFDTMDVFALQIEGQKTWRLFDGQFNHPIEQPGFNYTSLPKSHHESAKGQVLKESVMTPGDVLYIPRGQYHDALASNGASLHLSFGVTEPTGHDLLNILLNSIIEDPVFRESLPHIDDAQQHHAHVARLGQRLHTLLSDPESSIKLREYQRKRAFRDFSPGYTFPSQSAVETYRICSRVSQLNISGGIYEIQTAADPVQISENHGAIVEWLWARDYFSFVQLETAFPATSTSELRALLELLEHASVIEAL